MIMKTKTGPQSSKLDHSKKLNNYLKAELIFLNKVEEKLGKLNNNKKKNSI